jgi:hypothetical protein
MYFLLSLTLNFICIVFSDSTALAVLVSFILILTLVKYEKYRLINEWVNYKPFEQKWLFNGFVIFVANVLLSSYRLRWLQTLILTAVIFVLSEFDNGNTQISVLTSLLVAVVFNLVVVESNIEYKRMLRAKIVCNEVITFLRYSSLMKALLKVDCYNHKVDGRMIGEIKSRDMSYLCTKTVTELSLPRPAINHLNTLISSNRTINSVLESIHHMALEHANSLKNSSSLDGFDELRHQLELFTYRQKDSFLSNVPTKDRPNMFASFLLESSILPLETIEFWFRVEMKKYFVHAHNIYPMQPYDLHMTKHHYLSRNAIKVLPS